MLSDALALLQTQDIRAGNTQVVDFGRTVGLEDGRDGGHIASSSHRNTCREGCTLGGRPEASAVNRRSPREPPTRSWPLRDRRILITGGSGLIGLHVASELLRRGVTPVVYDIRRPTGLRGAEWVEGDVLDQDALHRAAEKVEGILHLASPLGVGTTERHPRETLDVIVLGTRNVCEVADPIQRIVFASTSEIYGEALQIPTPETCPPSPKSVYGVAKLVAESYVRTCVGPRGPHFTILRFFSVYGPGQTTDFVIPRFVQQAMRNEPLTVHGKGDQVRAFVHVQDVAVGTVLALLTAAAAGKTYNIGNPAEPVTMYGLAQRVVKLSKSKSRILRLPFSKSDRSANREIYRRIPNIRAATADLGYRPTVSLDEGIRDVIAHLRARGCSLVRP